MYKIPNSLILTDSLSEVARKERKYLLFISSLGLIVASTGLLPTEISALGVKFGAADQRSIIYCISGAIAYFIVAFAIYGYSDYLAWRSRINEATRERVLDERDGVANSEGLDELDIDEVHPELNDEKGKIDVRSVHTSLVRAFFEFAFPILVGLVAIVYLLFGTLSTKTNPNQSAYTIPGSCAALHV